MFKRNYHILIPILMVFFVFVPDGAQARLTDVEGIVSFGYKDYDMKNKSGLKGSADSFYQRYNLGAGLTGNLYNEKSGLYNLYLTYNYEDYKNKVGGEKYSLNSGTFSWQGDFKLSLYHLNGFNALFYSTNNEYRQYDYAEFLGGGELSYGFETDVDEKFYRRNGFYGGMGVNGGPYYYFSYYTEEWEEIWGDENSKISSGSFSVNKGVNWLTITKTESDPGDWDEFVLHVGNVGNPVRKGSKRSIYTPRRYWYRISNWMSVSTDYRYSRKKSPTIDLESNRLTFALSGNRKNWNAHMFSTYGRTNDGNVNSHSLNVPVWLRASPSPNAYLGVKSAYSENAVTNEMSAKETKTQAVNEELTLWARPKDDFALESKYTFNKSDSDIQDSIKHSFWVRGYTQKRKKMNYRFSYTFDIAETDQDTSSHSSYSHNLKGYLSYSLDPKKVVSLDQRVGVHFNEGVLPDENSRSVGTRLYFRSDVGAKSDFMMEISRSLLKYDDGSEIIRDEANLDFTSRVSNKAFFKAFLNYDMRDSDIVYDSVYDQYRSEMKLTYKESKELVSISTLFNNKNYGISYSGTVRGVSETVEYNYFRHGFDKRTIVNTQLSLAYSEQDTDFDVYNYINLSFNVNYYPRRGLSCGAMYTLRENLDDSHREANSGVHFGIYYPLLTVKGQYRHREYQDGYDVEEDRYQIDIVKKF